MIEPHTLIGCGTALNIAPERIPVTHFVSTTLCMRALDAPTSSSHVVGFYHCTNPSHSVLCRFLFGCLIIVHVGIYGDQGDVGRSGKLIKVCIVAEPNDFYWGVVSADGGGRNIFCSVL